MSFFRVDEQQRVERIRQLNDNLRTTFGGGKIIMSVGVAELSHDLKAAALMELRKFAAFDQGNDPWSEHDFGSFVIGHYTFVFKIDYYDKEMIGASEDPADFDKTTRVLTLCTQWDY